MKFVNLNVVLFICLIIACGLVKPAAADDSGFYVEFGGGRSNASESTTSLDENATALRLAAGYQINSWLAVDAGYVDFGDFDGELMDPAGGTVPFSASATGIELAFIGRIPLGERFAATVRAEQLWWDSEIEAVGQKQEDSGNSFAYGAGLEFGLNDRFVLTGNWQQFEMRETDVDLFSLGIRIGFGASSGD
jgi:opacity protein-like surface antigen